MIDFIHSLFNIYIVFLGGFTVSNYLFYSVVSILTVYITFVFVYRLMRSL